MRALLEGASYPLRALAALGRAPRLWRFIVLPVVINMAVGAALYAGLLLAGLRWVEGVVAGLPAWAAPLGTLLQILLVVGLLVATGFLLVRFGVVLGSPFYSRLSEELEIARLGAAPPAEPLSLRGVARDLWRALAYELKKLALALALGTPLLLANLLPVAGQAIATTGGIALGATIACLDFLDPPLERRRLRFRAKLAVVRRALPASAGFGLACLGLVSIPLVNLLAIPLCVAAGTLFFCDRLAHNV
ncbi:MAG TPA: EI24 domain-containing protein [Roseiflexaceae bacterium]|nr:EI24 domain-containing protein [Roseiflexaceae bacterium]